MKPLISSNKSKYRMEHYPIEWEKLIKTGITLDRENGISYLENIKKYCNNGGIPVGIAAKNFEFNSQPAFDEMLSEAHHWFYIQRKLVKYLFTKTDIVKSLSEFEEDPELLLLRLTRARFEFLSSFKIEGELSEYLYRYGMYGHFYDDHSAADAVKIAREFCQFLYEGDPGNVLCFRTRNSWGKWFDPYSCSNNSFVFINKKERNIWLFCFSHSD